QKNQLSWGFVKRTNLPHRCRHCQIELLTGESSGFCCGAQGEKVAEIPRLRPLPDEYLTFINDPRVSSVSRLLNLIYTFAQLESTHQFPEHAVPAHFAIEGRIYHR
ncbi:hypothetical protein AURDEDRAFT_19428, partial [Auricularia subglabra TFB-10046 SS5]